MINKLLQRFAAFSGCILSIVIALSPAESHGEYTHLFQLRGEVAAFDVSLKELHLIDGKAEKTSASRKIAVKGQVSGVESVPNGLVAVATGIGRGDLQAPIRLTLYDKNGKEQGVAFEKVSERPSVTFLKMVGDKLWITFFESKFVTKTGFFTPSTNYPWAFNEVVTERLGDVTAILGDDVLVGRPYGEPQGQDGDALLVSAGNKTTLPSYRGVRSITTWNESPRDHVVLGDGWHQNYGQLAQGRLSLLTWNERSKRYALEILDRDSTQYNFNKLIPISLDQKRYLAALGNRSFHFYKSTDNWQRTVVYSRASEETFFDVALLSIDSNKARFLVLDKELHFVEVGVS